MCFVNFAGRLPGGALPDAKHAMSVAARKQSGIFMLQAVRLVVTQYLHCNQAVLYVRLKAA